MKISYHLEIIYLKDFIILQSWHVVLFYTIPIGKRSFFFHFPSHVIQAYQIYLQSQKKMWILISKITVCETLHTYVVKVWSSCNRFVPLKIHTQCLNVNLFSICLCTIVEVQRTFWDSSLTLASSTSRDIKEQDQRTYSSLLLSQNWVRYSHVQGCVTLVGLWR